MGNHSLRKDMTCLNCGHVVEKRFCPNCGQENKETKESFHFLFTHTVEDIVHYDSGFWKTIKYLLLYPGKLTIEYLAGKRKTYVPPVKLYIFISFITFFIIPIIAKYDKDVVVVEKTETQNEVSNLKNHSNESDIKLNVTGLDLKSYDSIQNTLSEDKKDNLLKYWATKSILTFEKNSSNENFSEKVLEAFFHNLPKAFFILMPLFALILWLFHDKKKWYYFDHGIFTLHYSSMLLLTVTIYTLIEFIFDKINITFFNELLNYITFGMLLWWVIYFYSSYKKFYQQSKYILSLKLISIFFINLLLVTIILILFFIYSTLNVK
ncbi:MAG: DUF3667 domain-containing protein [Limnohabitans sp.]|nr:DUF3667 domain-containing protein [Limnohabitans sp.]